MAEYEVKYKIKGPDKNKTLSKTVKVDASSLDEAKKKVKPQVEKDRAKFARNYSELDPKPRVSYSGSSQTLKAKNTKSGIVVKVSKANPKTGDITSSQRTGGSRRSVARSSGGRMIGGNPARSLRSRSGGVGVFKMPDVLDLKNV